MKRSLRIFGLASLLALPVAAHAQNQKSVSFGASGGLSLPMGDLGDAAEAGYSVAGHVYLKPSSMKNLAFRLDVSYDSWGAKGVSDLEGDFTRSTRSVTGSHSTIGDVSFNRLSASSASSAVADASLSSLGVTGNVLFSLGDESAGMRPYLLAGGGMYRTKATVSILGFEGSSTSTDAGVQAGAGLEFKLAGFSTFLEAKFVNVFGDGDSSTYIPITFGVKF
jgi:hypothetical protein